MRGHLADSAPILTFWFAASEQIGIRVGNVPEMLRYAVIGLWLGAGAPWVFVMVRLTKREQRTAAD